MKSCVGCIHLSGNWCHQNRPMVYYKDPYTERSGYKRNPKLSTARERRESDCGKDRVLYEPTMMHRLWIAIKGDE